MRGTGSSPQLEIEIDVRGFIVARHISPGSWGRSLLAPLSKRTQAYWSALQPYFLDEIGQRRSWGRRSKHATTPFASGRLHRPGKFEGDWSVETDGPFAAPSCQCGLRMVENGLEAAGIEP